ncbi:MAG: DUF4058 family protein [Chloroflexi bacterium]|nr:DUF4058 family protein [Chloroflexota bacterium]
MPTPFPGMDPCLEHPYRWPDVHNRLIVHMADELAGILRPRYFVSIEERIYASAPGSLGISGRADVAVRPQAKRVLREASVHYEPQVMPIAVKVPRTEEIRESYLEVRAVEDKCVITVIEILSPSNKRPGTGRDTYLQKRDDVLRSETHLLEIDLLRIGDPMPIDGEYQDTHYRILLSRSQQRPRADLYAFSFKQPIPPFPLPLGVGEDELDVDLNRILHELYDRAGYDLVIDYQSDLQPPLAAEDRAWVTICLGEAGVSV